MVNGLTRSELKEKTKEILKQNYSKILLLLLIIILSSLYSTFLMTKYQMTIYNYGAYRSTTEDILAMSRRTSLFSLALLIIAIPLNGAILNIVRGKDYKDAFSVLGTGSFWLMTILSSFLIALFVSLGFLLLIIPGIILAYRFSQSTYLIYDLSATKEVQEYFNNNGTVMGPLKISSQIMKGKKVDYFVFNLSFILWYLLSAVTFGLASFYVTPYINTANALWYSEL